MTVKHEISFKEYMPKEAAEDSLVNLAVVIEDVKSQERVLASEEFNISTPTLNVQVCAGPTWTFILASKETWTPLRLTPFGNNLLEAFIYNAL